MDNRDKRASFADANARHPMFYSRFQLKGLDYPYQPDPDVGVPSALGQNEVHLDALVYKMKPSSVDLTGEVKTFHFALATGRYKDNRIPPKGFRIAQAFDRLCHLVDHGSDANAMYTSAEFVGGYDEVSLTILADADYVEITLNYQTTSREYIEFLRDDIQWYRQSDTIKPHPVR